MEVCYFDSYASLVNPDGRLDALGSQGSWVHFKLLSSGDQNDKPFGGNALQTYTATPLDNKTCFNGKKSLFGGRRSCNHLEEPSWASLCLFHLFCRSRHSLKRVSKRH